MISVITMEFYFSKCLRWVRLLSLCLHQVKLEVPKIPMEHFWVNSKFQNHLWILSKYQLWFKLARPNEGIFQWLDSIHRCLRDYFQLKYFHLLFLQGQKFYLWVVFLCLQLFLNKYFGEMFSQSFPWIMG